MRFKKFIDPSADDLVKRVEPPTDKALAEPVMLEDLASDVRSEGVMDAIHDYFVENHVKQNNPHAYNKMKRGE